MTARRRPPELFQRRNGASYEPGKGLRKRYCARFRARSIRDTDRLYYSHQTSWRCMMLFERTKTEAPDRVSIHPDTALGPATLAVADAERSLRFYRDLLGFEVLRREGPRIELGAGGATLL